MSHWTLAFLAALLTGLLATVCGGLVAGACVSWYRVSSFEGQSGFFVVGLALLSGILGFVVGAVTALIVLKGPHGSFPAALGWSSGIVAGIALLAASVAWLLADIPPRIDGDTLTLEAELRLPKGESLPSPEGGYSYLKLFSLSGSKVRSHWNGDAHLHLAREEDGHWIVPGEVELFTMKGVRSLAFCLGGEEARGFLLPLPARPGTRFLEWSDWLPPGDSPGTEAALRFRLRRNPPPVSLTYEEHVRREAEARLATIATLDPDAPMDKWLPHLDGGADDEGRRLAVERIVGRSGFRDELAGLFVADAPQNARTSLRLVDQLEPDAGTVAAVAAAGEDIAARIRAYNERPPEEDPSHLGAADVSMRFGAWIAAARFLRENAGGDFVPELREILELSRVRPDSISMRQDVRRVASHYLHQWAGVEPLPTDSEPQ